METSKKQYKCPACDKFFEADVPAGGEAPKCPSCGTAQGEADEILPPGSIVGGFVVERLVGRGGMGSVYLAKQKSMGRMVALKILHRSHVENKEAVGQFLAEMRSTGQLSHRNLVTALDAGEDGGLYFMAMKFIDGEDLDKRLEAGKAMPEAEALDIGIKVASALDYVQKKLGLFHKDIKPGNIMLDRNKEAFLLDLGIAELAGGERRKEGKVVGSPYYMSPEQTRNEKLDWSTDQYSLGATLYHLIVGAPPYDDEVIGNILRKHGSEPFPEPKARNPGAAVSPGCVEFLRKAMGKTPAERFASWEEFIAKAKEVLETGGKLKPPRKSAASAKKPLKGPAAPPPSGGAAGRAPASLHGGHSLSSIFMVSGIIVAALLGLITLLVMLSGGSATPGGAESGGPGAGGKPNVKMCEMAIAKAKEQAAKGEHRQILSTLAPYENIKDELLSEAVASMLAEARAQIEAEEKAKELERKEAAEALRRQAEEARAAEEAKAAEKLKAAEAEKALYESFLDKALPLARSRDLKALRELAAEVKAAPWGDMAVDAGILAGILAEYASIDDNILAHFERKKGGDFIDLRLNGKKPVKFKVKSTGNGVVKGSVRVESTLKVRPMEFKPSDLPVKTQVELSGLTRPQALSLFEALMAQAEGDAAAAAAAAASAGPFKERLARSLDAIKGGAKGEGDAESAFYAILSNYFGLTYERPSLKKVLFDMETARPKTNAPWAAHCDMRAFLAKHGRSEFAKEYKEPIKTVHERLWKDLPVTAPDIFKAAKVTFKPETSEITLDYDFSDQGQLEDWGGVSTADGAGVCEPGKAALHCAVFDSVSISAEIAAPGGEAGLMLMSKSNDFQLVFKAVSPSAAFLPECYLAAESGNAPVFRAEPGRAAGSKALCSLAYAKGTATAAAGKEKFKGVVKDFDYIQAGFYANKAPAQFRNVRVSGALNKKWLVAPLEEKKEKVARTLGQEDD